MTFGHRAAWHEALAALGPADGPDVRGMSDGLLLHLRDTYPVETAWAPQWTGDALRQVRVGARDARLAALRATAETAAARRDGRHEQASRQQALAASYQAMHDAYRQHEAAFAATMADRADWERATRHQRHLAVAADTELRRRHPDQRWHALRSAEPQLLSQAQDDDSAPVPRHDSRETEQLIRDLAARHRDFSDRLASRQTMMIPAEDSDFEDLAPAFPAWTEPRRDAILQPPRPQIQPAEQIPERTVGRQADMEAGG